MDLSMEIDEEEEDLNELKKSKTPKRKNRSKIDEDGVVVTSSKKRNIKGIILSITKPSYTLKRGIGRELRSLRWEHRNRLRYLLRQLVRRQNWDEASGVLSVLLKGTHMENSLSTNRSKYRATLEILEHMGAAKVKPKRIQQVYEIWMKKSFAATRNNRSLKGRFDVLLEYILFCLSKGDTNVAYHAVISLLQESGFASDPKANLVAGLAFSQFWYNSIKMELNFHNSCDSGSPVQSVMSGSQKSVMSINRFNQESVVEVKVQASGSFLQQDSNTSVRMGKTVNLEEGVVDRDKAVKMEVDYNLKQEIPEFDEIHMKSGVSDDHTGNSSQFPHTGEKQFGSIYARDLDDLLMPLTFPKTNMEDFISFQQRIQNDDYKSAIKHFRVALHSTTPAFEALLPLVQMLLFGDQVKEAIEEVESVIQNSHASLPYRLKASLLEHFSNEDPNKLCNCFEDTLNKDPTCTHSITKLIDLHNHGHYSLEKLVEMIGLHLDATYAGCHMWKKFASCFIRLSQCDEDRMSSCVDGSYSKSSKKVPDFFKDDLSKENWKLRCRCWKTRHFTQSRLASEVTSGNMELIAYKAASACHLYGREFTYVVKACTYLEKEKEKNQELLFLKMHMENAIGLYTR